MKITLSIFITSILLGNILLQGCKSFVEVDPPKTNLISETVFKEDITAIAAMSSVYGLMNTSGFSSGNVLSITYLSGLSSDEYKLYSTSADQVQFSNTALSQTNGSVGSIWSSAYATIYRVNAIIEGVAKSNTLSPVVKTQLEGEAKFVRAFSFFYLVNLYGEVPLSITTDYKVNSVMPKSPQDSIYKQIIKDLKEAQNILAADYSFAGGERVRINKWAATAMLARVYLYRNDWANAEIEATKVIDNTAMYKLTTSADVFLKNSNEAIWQLNNNTLNTNEVSTYVFTTRPTTVALHDDLFKSFEANDTRKSAWVVTKVSSNVTYYQSTKYKAAKTPPVTTPVTQPVEYSMVMRLAEQFLIRAEARTQLDKIKGLNSAEVDVNAIRTRAGLTGTPAATKEAMLLAIENERKLEFFSEWGHRWLDLKRTGRANAVLAALKGSNWQITDLLYPIPLEQLQNNPSMRDAQNPGYN